MINTNDFLLYSEHFEGPAYLYWIEYKPTNKRKLIEEKTAYQIRDKYGIHLMGEREHMKLIREEAERIKAERKEREKYRH